MDSASTSGYMHSAANTSAITEPRPDEEQAHIRSLSDDPTNEVRLLREAQLDLARVMEFPTVEDIELQIEALASESQETADGAIQSPEKTLWHDDANHTELFKLDTDAAVVELKEPAQRGSVKHRFDELKINFLARYGKDAVKAVLFLGTTRGDGTSTAAFNFAQSLAQDRDARVMYINGDLRAPSAVTSTTDAGLSNLAESEVYVPPTALHGNVHVLPSGRNYADPAVLFQSKRFRSFMAQVSQQFDYVIVDGPPLDEAPESVALCTHVDGVILTIDAQRTRRRTALRAKLRVEQVGGRLLGVVLNRRKYYVPDWLYKLI